MLDSSGAILEPKVETSPKCRSRRWDSNPRPLITNYAVHFRLDFDARFLFFLDQTVPQGPFYGVLPRGGTAQVAIHGLDVLEAVQTEWRHIKLNSRNVKYVARAVASVLV